MTASVKFAARNTITYIIEIEEAEIRGEAALGHLYNMRAHINAQTKCYGCT